MTFQFSKGEDEHLSLKNLIGQAIGAGSMCWENLEGAGVFDDPRAKEIVEALYAEIVKRQDEINEAYSREFSAAKKHFNKETERLRSLIDQAWGRWVETLQDYFPELYKDWRDAGGQRTAIPVIMERQIAGMLAAMDSARGSLLVPGVRRDSPEPEPVIAIDPGTYTGYVLTFVVKDKKS